MNLISKAFVAYSMDILKDKSMLSSRHNVQHGDISVFTHGGKILLFVKQKV